jgi:hypothetical protein
LKSIVGIIVRIDTEPLERQTAKQRTTVSEEDRNVGGSFPNEVALFLVPRIFASRSNVCRARQTMPLW